MVCECAGKPLRVKVVVGVGCGGRSPREPCRLAFEARSILTGLIEGGTAQHEVLKWSTPKLTCFFLPYFLPCFLLSYFLLFIREAHRCAHARTGIPMGTSARSPRPDLRPERQS